MSNDVDSTTHDSHSEQAVHNGDIAHTGIMGAEADGISWSTVFEGLKISTGIRFFIVFAAFVSWLYVIYWIRHHEPFSDQVIGMSSPKSSTADADRFLVAGIKRVFPFQTPATLTGSFYAPIPGSSILPSGAINNNYVLGRYDKRFGEANQSGARMTSYAASGQAIPSPLIGPADQQYDQRFGSPARP